MTAVLKDQPSPKGFMSVQPVNWLPGSLSAALPFFALDGTKLMFRADDPNLQGVTFEGITQSPLVKVNNSAKNTNKGYNFYSAPWAIPHLTTRDLGKRTEITEIDHSIQDQIASLFALVGIDPQNPTNDFIVLGDFKLEKTGQVKQYQVIGGSKQTNRNGVIQFGGANDTNTQISGVSTTMLMYTPLISDDFTYNGNQITTVQMPQNTFQVVDTPIVISCVDMNNMSGGRIQFTLQNQVTMQNTSTYST